MIALRRLVFLFATAAVAAVAAPLERDLGQGLGYVRMKSLPADLPAKPVGKVAPCVVDIRYVEADGAAVSAWAAWLRFRASPRSPVFVLANASTSLALVTAITPRVAGDGLIVIGTAAGHLRPDSAVRISPEDERKAYDALENGADVATLLAENPDKIRNDEASLVRGQTGRGTADLPADNAAEAPRRPPPTIDAALQRGVHLHRALVALKML